MSARVSVSVLRGWACFAAVLCALPACGRKLEPKAARVSGEQRVSSNILRQDYAGSLACRGCHADIYESFLGSAMHRMTRAAATAEIRAPFDGRQFAAVGEDRATLFEHDGARLMRLQTRRHGERLYRITKVIGGRHREDFVGVDVTGARNPARSPARSVEHVLPVSYVFESSELRYKGYSVMVPERDALHVGPKWSATCIGCHNTLPLLTMLYDDLLGPDAPPYQGSVADGFFPEQRSYAAVALEPAHLTAAIVDELAVIHPDADAPSDASLPELLDHAITTTRRHLRDHHLIELGVGCEACHGGAREHVEDHRVLPSFAVRSPLLRLQPASGRASTPAEDQSRACLRCHTVLFSGYPWTWEGGQRRVGEAGGSSTNSGEARDFLLGGCAQQMTCSSCHNPHGVDHRERLQALATPEGNTSCVRCHSEFATPGAMTAHSHHAPGSAGNACVSCHMPKKNTALEYRLTRYHRIGTPTDEERVLHDRPLECALCHTDQSTEALVTTMERLWGKRYDRDGLRRLYGDLERPTLDATLERGKPHEQLAAIGALAEYPVDGAATLLLPHLAHDYPQVRLFAKRAIEQVSGRSLDVDIHAQASQVRAQLESIRAFLEQAENSPAAAPP